VFGGFRNFHLEKYIVHIGHHSTHEKVLSHCELYALSQAAGTRLLLPSGELQAATSGRLWRGRRS